MAARGWGQPTREQSAETLRYGDAVHPVAVDRVEQEADAKVTRGLARQDLGPQADLEVLSGPDNGARSDVLPPFFGEVVKETRGTGRERQ